MPAKCRVIVCGFDPMLVRGYLKTGARALWWYLPDEIYEEFKVKPGYKVKGKLLAVYNAKGEKQDAWPTEDFEQTPGAGGPPEAVGDPFVWETSEETGLAVVLPSATIIKYQLTAFHFLELVIEAIIGENGDEIEVYPGEERAASKWWPEEKMKLTYHVPFVAP